METFHGGPSNSVVLVWTAVVVRLSICGCAVTIASTVTVTDSNPPNTNALFPINTTLFWLIIGL